MTKTDSEVVRRLELRHHIADTMSLLQEIALFESKVDYADVNDDTQI